MITMRPDVLQCTVSRATKPWSATEIPPARPESAAESTAAISLGNFAKLIVRVASWGNRWWATAAARWILAKDLVRRLKTYPKTYRTSRISG